MLAISTMRCEREYPYFVSFELTVSSSYLCRQGPRYPIEAAAIYHGRAGVGRPVHGRRHPSGTGALGGPSPSCYA